ncbi:MAG: FHA domain-containing protein [Actinobacteria bacterium]|nr:FHA domain-containing protein [Actinomycetota bacterium]
MSWPNLLIASSAYATIVRPLQSLVLLGVILFFIRVLSIATQEMRPPKEESGRRQRRRPLSLAFMEPEAQAGECIEVANPVVLGRGAPSDIVLDDTFLSTQHARFSTDGGDLFIEDLGSRNGSYINAEPVIHRTQLLKGDVIQIGNVILEVVR